MISATTCSAWAAWDSDLLECDMMAMRLPRYDDGQVGERTFDFPKHLVHRAKHGHRIKLLGYRDGACSGGHRTSSDVGIGGMWTIRRAFRR